MQGLWRKVRWSLKQRGWTGTFTASAKALMRGLRRSAGGESRHPFDVENGTDTSGLVAGGNLASGSKNDIFITAYVGIAPSRLRHGLARWQSTLENGERMEDFAFVDLGCGKGRAALIASELPFREIAGVELNPQLARTAQSNLRTWKSIRKARSPVSFTRGDAAEFTLPPGPCLVFLYNPFAPPVMRAVLKALQRRVDDENKRLDILYQTEQPETPLRTDARLRLLWTGAFPLEGEEASADPVSSPTDVTSLYRWVG